MIQGSWKKWLLNVSWGRLAVCQRRADCWRFTCDVGTWEPFLGLPGSRCSGGHLTGGISVHLLGKVREQLPPVCVRLWQSLQGALKLERTLEQMCRSHRTWRSGSPIRAGAGLLFVKVTIKVSFYICVTHSMSFISREVH